MSYALHLAGDAKADLAELDPWLQEEVLDEVERLVASAPAGLRTDCHGTAVHDFERLAHGTRHLVFLRFHLSASPPVLSLTSVKDWMTAGS